MLNEEVSSLLNSLFKESKIPIEVKELILYRPVWHDPLFENIEPINDIVRLSVCDPLWMEIRFELGASDKRSYEYHVECRNQNKKFVAVSHMLKYCDIYPKEDPKEIEKNNEKTMDFLTSMLTRMLDILCRKF